MRVCQSGGMTPGVSAPELHQDVGLFDDGRRRRRAGRRTRPLTAMQAVRRGLVPAAVLWQLLWILAQPTLWPLSQPTVAAGLAIVAILVASVVLLAVHLLGSAPAGRRMATIDAGVVVVATIVVNVGQASAPVPNWHGVAELAALAAGVAGLLLSFRWSLLATAAMTVLLVRDTLIPNVAEGPQLSVEVILDPVYVLAVGISSAVARRALLIHARAADDAVMAALAMEQERRTVELVEQGLRATERTLHESVLNTLVAVARGGLDEGMTRRLRHRCDEASRLLAALRGRSMPAPLDDPGSGGLVEGLRLPVADLRDAGVEVTVIDKGPGMPRAVLAAMRTAATEALINVGRHAQASAVTIRIDCTRSDTVDMHTVRIEDNGIGLPAELPEGRFGIADAIVGAMVEVGGSAVVRRHDDAGTEVVLTCRVRDDHAPKLDSVLAPAPADLAIPVLGAMLLYATALVIGTRADVESVALNTGAFLIWLLLALMVGFSSTRGRLGIPVLVTAAAGGWLLYAIQESSLVPGATGGWASPAIAGLFLVVAAAGPRWGWILLLVTWLTFQGDPLFELTQSGTAMIFIGALLGRSLRRNAQIAWQQRQEEMRQNDAAQVARRAIDRVHVRYRALSESGAPELLAAIASGEADPRTHSVREAAALEERFIRNVMRLDPQGGSLHRLAASLVVVAHRRGCLLDVEVVPDLPTGSDLDPEGEACLVRLMDGACRTTFRDGQGAGSTARFSVRREGDEVAVRLLVPLSDAPEWHDSRAGTRVLLVDPDDPAGALWLCETVVHTDQGDS